MSHSESAYRLFIGGIAPITTRDTLRTFFEQFGTVTEAHIVMRGGTSSGYGYITMGSQSEVDTVLQTSPQLLSIDHRIVTAELAGCRAPGTGRKEPVLVGVHNLDEDAPHPGKLFVGGITFSTTSQDLYDFFGKYGTVVDAIAMQKKDGSMRGFGWVTYATAEEADVILGRPETEWVLNGRGLNIKRPSGDKSKRDRSPSRDRGRSRDYGRSSSRRAQSPISRAEPGKLFIGGIDPETSTQDIKDVFSKYGEVIDAVAMTRPDGSARGFGWVTFATAEDADYLLSLPPGSIYVRSREVSVKRPEDRTRYGAPERRSDPPRSASRGGYDSYDSYPSRHTSSSSFRAPPPPFEDDVRLPPGWEKRVDPASGRTYYADRNTKQTHWTLPDNLKRGAPPSFNQPSKRGRY